VIVPFTADTVPIIDIAGRRMVLDPVGMLGVEALLARAKG
jgi:hypothetical protein